MLEFVALPVKVGDCFMIRNDGFTAIIDGGMNRKEIVSIVRRELPKRTNIDVIICTHYDADHINGILGLLQSRYQFRELWLPEIYGSLCNTITSNIQELITYWKDRIPDVNFTQTVDPPDYHLDDANPEEEDSQERIDADLLEVIAEHFCALHFFFNRRNSPQDKMVLNLWKISQLVSEGLRSGAYIKWFKYSNMPTNQKLNHGFTALNAQRTSVSIYTPQVFYEVLALTTINKQSLVFRYDNTDFPSILFTADSDLAFVVDKIILPDHSVVTAPHHGSGENDSAYDRISGLDLIFVRSDRSQAKRPGEGYLKQDRRYCTICRNNNNKKRVALKLSPSGTDYQEGNKCICEKKAT